ncbi:Copper binding protein, plastocyanin/azurin family [Verrucomicrobiia bacterium DG1235]|nr:Copper binding protein, plastocyanin/azurin family [Verrucomicrobiae bacterium DG1235]
MIQMKLKTTLVALAASLSAVLANAAEVTVTADDTMRFDTATIEATAGEPLTIVFKNQGSLPKAAMGHNLVVLKPGSDLATFGNAAVTAAANEYIPTQPDLAAQVLGHSKLLGPKESDTFILTFDAPGEYPFLCSFPGHWALMKGAIVVK